MATSIYVFENDDIFHQIYKDVMEDPLYIMKIIDLYVKGDHLWIVTNSNDKKEKPRLSNTLVHFRQGSVKEWEDGDEKLVKYGDIRYNHKKGQLEFFPRMLRKPLLSMRVGRCITNSNDKYRKVDYDKRFYDFTNNRIIFLMENKE
jgi:hypothetical protein|tara:strand:+ start:374 stop:811 length:438 start_codon:yes stop_codon:yes gene_type:complete